MRVAALILGLVASIIAFVHSFLAILGSAVLEVGGEVFEDPEAVTEGESLASGAGYGVFAAILGTIAAALALSSTPAPHAFCLLLPLLLRLGAVRQQSSMT